MKNDKKRFLSHGVAEKSNNYQKVTEFYLNKCLMLKMQKLWVDLS